MFAADAFPTVVSVALAQAPAIDASSVAWEVTFSAPVTGVDARDFSLATSGTKAGAPLVVSGSGANYTVTAPRIAGSGTVGLNLVDDGSIRDATGNVLRRQSPVATFDAQVTYGTGVYPTALAAGDFNDDGKPDVVTANMYGSSVSVLMGKGGGTFHPQQSVPAGGLPLAVTVGDVNDDGAVDIVVANHVDDAVGVLLGNGDGTFKAQQAVAVGSRPSAVVVGDMNGDGKLDIAAANEADNTVSVLLGNGDGTFVPQATLTAGWSPRGLAIGDLDGDGVLDLVAANSNDDRLGVFLGDGDGTFAAQQAFATGATPSSVVIGDVDGDGVADLVSANWLGESVSVLVGNGDGTFAPQRAFAVARAMSVSLGDVNLDGVPDIVCASGDSAVRVLHGNGDATFGSPQAFSVGDGPWAVAVSDLDGDNKPDVLTVNATSRSVSVLRNNQQGGFAGEVATLRQVFPVVESIAFVGTAPTASPTMRWRVAFSEPVTGVDGGDFAPVLSGGTTSGGLSVIGSGSTYTVTVSGVSGPGTIGLNLVDNGTIRDVAGNPLVRQAAAAVFTPLEPVRAGVDPRSIAVGDVNRDGHLDLAMANAAINYSFKQVTLLLGKGDGTFQALRGFDVASRPLAVAIADMNSDGNPDIVSAGSDGDSVCVLVGNGDGTFRLQQAADVGAAAVSIAVADVNGDGMLDVATANPSAGTLSVLLGRGDGTFQPRRTLTAGSLPDSIAVADVDGDQKLDLISVNSGSNALGIFLGNGDGSFQPQQTVDAGNLPTSIAIGDLNGDGKADLVTANLVSDTVSVLLGEGDGTFQSRQTVAVGRLPEAVALGDINGDGRLDLFAGNFWGNSISALVGKGNGTFEPHETFTTGQEPFGVVVGDMNGDGRSDLVTIDYGGYTASVLLNAGRGGFTGPVVEHLGTALAPQFGQPVRSTGDFSVQITNYDPAFSWSLSKLSASGSATLSDTGLITVTGLTPGAATTLVVATSRPGHADGAATTTIRTLQSARVPTLAAPVPLANGFSVQITNYDHRFSWVGVATAGGSVRISRTGLVTVTGAESGEASTLTLTASRKDHASGSAVVAVTTLRPSLVPSFGPVTRTRFTATFQIMNYDPAHAWSGSVSPHGSVRISRTGLVTIVGIPAGLPATVRISTARAGHAAGVTAAVVRPLG